MDVNPGYRAETAGGFSYEVGYSRNFYQNDGGNCCGDVKHSLGLPLGDTFKDTFEAANDPDPTLSNVYVGLEFLANDKITLSANYGTYQVADAGIEQGWDRG